ncbi:MULTISPECIES: hypothetical protein [unclassified Streptomyces]|uniref:hypothetical protein n=1 Tax=unclassified Streptomyces TaxID=2593676 RepID=UPI002E2D89AF|nr:hypothetical protein [Streptomyces sp. NBC_01601]
MKKIEHAASILSDGMASIHEAMSDMADSHIDNEELIRWMFSRVGAKGEGQSK